MGEQQEVRVGTRVSCDGHYGVVRYVGPVVGTKGIWMGIEWDDPNRGKHNGCHNGAQYFYTRSDTGGSFIRPQKVDSPMSVPEAIRSKYLSGLEGPLGAHLDENKDVLLMETPRCNRVVEFVGPEKTATLLSRGETIKEVSLSHWPVDHPGEEGEVARLVPNLTYLDLSHTLLSSWEQVAQLVRPLHRLSLLILSKNMLSIPKCPEDLQDSFKGVKQMILRDVGYSWDEVVSCAHMWPWVEDLVVSANGIATLSPLPETLLNSLQHLSLQENPIANWETVCHLGRLPSLKSLTLADCDLTSVSFPDTEPGEKTTLFAGLVSLNLNSNRLEEWSSIAELDKLSRLEELVVKGNPVTVREKRHMTRYLLVAYLGSLKVLDRMEISPVERREAGILYVNRFYPLWQQCGGDTAAGPTKEFLRLHPRFSSLLKVYGAPIEAPQPIKNRLVTVEILAPQDPERSPIRKRLPATMSVEKLKALVMQLYPRRGARVQLSHACAEQSKESSLDRELQDLNYYSVSDGSRIYVRW